MSKPTIPYDVILNCLSEVSKQLDYPATPLDMHRLEEKLLLFSNEIRLQDDLTILEICFKHGST